MIVTTSSTQRRSRETEVAHASSPIARDILGVDVDVLKRDEAFALVRHAIENGDHRKLAFLNAHGANIAYTNDRYRKVLQEFGVLSDGIGVDIGSKILYGERFPANLNGTDFIPDLLCDIEKPLHVALLGARDGVAEAAADAFSARFKRHRFSVVSDGYFSREEVDTLLGSLKADRPDILLVAFGNPKQELWIDDHITKEHAAVVFGVGALFDFVAGRVPRAPKIMIATRMEWIYRLWLEPGRMWRRYVLGNPIFLLRILKQRTRGKPPGAEI